MSIHNNLKHSPLSRLTLTEEEREVLSSKQAGSAQHRITPEFFTVLDKVARIKTDCQVNTLLILVIMINGAIVRFSSPPDTRPQL